MAAVERGLVCDRSSACLPTRWRTHRCFRNCLTTYNVIMLTHPCNIYPSHPLLYRKTGVYRSILFLIFGLKHRLWVLFKTASFSEYKKKCQTFSFEKSIIFKSRSILHRHVCVMLNRIQCVEQTGNRDTVEYLITEMLKMFKEN